MFAPWKWETKVQILTYCRANQEWQWRNTVFTIAQLNTCVYTSLKLTPIDRALAYLSIDSRYNPFLVYCRELAPGTVSLTGDRAQGDDSKHDSHYSSSGVYKLIFYLAIANKIIRNCHPGWHDSMYMML